MRKSTPATLARAAKRSRWVSLASDCRARRKGPLHAVLAINPWYQVVTRCGRTAPREATFDVQYATNRACPDCVLAICDAAGL